MKRWLIGMTAVIVMIAAAITPGLAATLAFGSQTFAGGSAAVATCDSDGLSVERTLSGANVVSVTVGRIAAACGNGTLSLTVSNGVTNVSGSAVVPAAGGSVVVTLAAPILATEAMTTDLTIVGA
jgi:hypothetical protein